MRSAGLRGLAATRVGRAQAAWIGVIERGPVPCDGVAMGSPSGRGGFDLTDEVVDHGAVSPSSALAGPSTRRPLLRGGGRQNGGGRHRRDRLPREVVG